MVALRRGGDHRGIDQPFSMETEAQYIGRCRVDHPKSSCVIGIGDRPASICQLVEEFTLGFCIVIHRFVVIEMVMAQIGESGHIKLYPFDSLLVRSEERR